MLLNKIFGFVIYFLYISPINRVKMIYTDGVYIISNISIEDLHDFAMCIGISGRYYRDKVYPHYDIPTPVLRRKALFAGAKLISSVEMAHIINSKLIKHAENM